MLDCWVNLGLLNECCQLTAEAPGFLAYGIGHVHESIWKGQAWITSLKFVFDGLVYGLVTAGIFGWLWP